MGDPGWQGDDGGAMAGRWRGPGMLGKLDVPDALDQNHYSELS